MNDTHPIQTLFYYQITGPSNHISLVLAMSVSEHLSLLSLAGSKLILKIGPETKDIKVTPLPVLLAAGILFFFILVREHLNLLLIF